MALDTIIFRKNTVIDPETLTGLSGNNHRIVVDWEDYNFAPNADGNYNIPLKEIFAGKAFLPYDSITNIGQEGGRGIYFGLHVVDLQVYEGDDEKLRDRYLLAEGKSYPGEAEDLSSSWLTRGPSVRPLYNDSMFLCFINPKATGMKVWIRGWYYDAQDKKYKSTIVDPYYHCTGTFTDNHALEVHIPITRLKFPSWWSQHYTIEAVDLWFTVETDSGDFDASRDCIRFLLRKPTANITTFAFRNGLGFLDSLCSSGEVADKPEYDQKTFTSQDMESELSVSSQRWIEVNTGRCDSEALRRQWQEFFESAERYVVHGTKIHRIIVSDVKCEQQLLQYGSATFKYKLSEKDFGQAMSRLQLQDYNG